MSINSVCKLQKSIVFKNFDDRRLKTRYPHRRDGTVPEVYTRKHPNGGTVLPVLILTVMADSTSYFLFALNNNHSSILLNFGDS